MKKSTFFCVVLAAIFTFSGVMATFAALKISSTSTQTINIASLKGRIVEEYQEATNVKAGQNIKKIVNVKNTGNSDSIVRVKIKKSWDSKAEISLDPRLIIIDCDKEFWYFNEQDGYYYYKGVLRPNETTKKPLFESFTVSNDVDSSYDSMSANIVVKMECIQAAANAISIWNMTFKELGITYLQEAIIDKTAEVVFDGKSFSFNPLNLFENFNDLLPGETRTQTINIKNAFTTDTEIFLRAEVAEQKNVDPLQLEKINKLLKEDVNIIVTDSSGKIIYDGAIWGNPTIDSKNPNSMKYDINLGHFSSNQEENLTVQLQVNPKLGNEYMSLWADIKWVWSAMGIENPVPPKTGELTNIYIYFIVMMASATTILIVLKSKEKQNKKIN